MTRYGAKMELTPFGRRSNDTVSGGDDTIGAIKGKTAFMAAQATIRSQVETSSNLIYGGNGDDLIQSYGFNSQPSDDKGKDTLYGGAGNDTVNGAGGRDQIYGGDGNDLLRGNNNWDHLYGGAGNDTIYGNRGADRIWGNEGDDFLLGFSPENEGGSDNGSNRIFGGPA